MNPLRLLVGAGALSLAALAALGQGTAFFYQGQLNAAGRAADGSFDFVFSLCDAAGTPGGTVTNPAVAVSNGLFSVSLDFGSAIYNGSTGWLEIAVRTNGGGTFTTLAPMQPLLATPYALMASTASNLAGPLPASQLSGAYPANVIFDNTANQFAGTFAGDGTSLANVDAAWLNGIPGSNYATLDILTNYAPANSITNSAAGSAIPAMTVFDAPGTNQFVVPAGISRIMVEVWGGGGGGGSAPSESHGAGGGGGGYGKGVFGVAPGTGYTVVVGAGGAASVAGGATSFGNLISATGGAGGSNSLSVGTGGLGGTSSAAINITGGVGQCSMTLGGNGGGSAGNGGSGGNGDSGSGAGNGLAPGGGSGGGEGDPGGLGGHGRVIIYY